MVRAGPDGDVADLGCLIRPDRRAAIGLHGHRGARGRRDVDCCSISYRLDSTYGGLATTSGATGTRAAGTASSTARTAPAAAEATGASAGRGVGESRIARRAAGRAMVLLHQHSPDEAGHHEHRTTQRESQPARCAHGAVPVQLVGEVVVERVRFQCVFRGIRLSGPLPEKPAGNGAPDDRAPGDGAPDDGAPDDGAPARRGRSMPHRFLHSLPETSPCPAAPAVQTSYSIAQCLDGAQRRGPLAG